MLEQTLAVLRQLLERGFERAWKLGLLFVVVCGGMAIASLLGVKLPQPVTEWSTTGLIAGVALMIVSWTVSVVGFCRRKLEVRAQRRAEAAEQAAEARQVRKNLATLTFDEIVQLERFLSAGVPTFQIEIGDNASVRLMRKGFLKVVRDMGMEWICEVHPTLLAEKERLAADLRELIRR